MILFVAHWCPHCRREVPKIAEWLHGRSEVDGVKLYAVATGTDPKLPNYPPSAWLAAEHWPVPTMADDDQGTAAAVYGLGFYPFFVVVKADGTVAARTSGEISTSQLDKLIKSAS